MDKCARQIWLSQEAARHAWAVAELSKEGRFGGPPDPLKRTELELWGTDAVVTALCRLQRCLHLFLRTGPVLPDEVCLQVKAFGAEFKRARVHECRQQLEEEPDMMGRGSLFRWRRVLLGRHGTALPVRPKLPYVRALGGDFDLRAVIRAGAALDPCLHAWSPTQKPGPRSGA